MLYLIFMLLWVSSLGSENDTLHLRYASVVWRHGARSPLHAYPSDPYNDKPLWPQGPGQLTQIGMQEQYNLGIYLRKRYNRLISSNYSRNEVYIRSTSIDRALMSAEANLAGLFQPQGRQRWNGSDTNWQPIPIHTVSLENEHLLLYFSNCPKYNKLQQEVKNSLQFKQAKEKYKNFLAELKPFTGFENNLNMSEGVSVYDALACEKGAGLKLPEWATQSRLSQLSSLTGSSFSFAFGAETDLKTPITKIGAGFLVKEIIENMEHAINQSQTYKANLYSGHDTTLIALLVALDAFDMKQPPFASSVMLELYEDKDENVTDKFIVKTFYRNSVSEPPIRLNILGCDLNCPFSEFKRRAADILPSSDKPDCGTNDNPTMSISIDTAQTSSKDTGLLNVTSLLYITASLLFLTWFVLLVALCRRKRQPRKGMAYQPLNSFDHDV